MNATTFKTLTSADRQKPPRKITAAENALSRAFAKLQSSLPGDARISTLRIKSFGVFEQVGIPTRRIEAWHYSDLRAAIGDGLELAGAADAAGLRAARDALPALSDERVRIVLVDGFYAPELSTGPLGGDVMVRALDEALSDPTPTLVGILSDAGPGRDEPVLALNAALMRGGVVIDVEPGHQPQTPIEITFVVSNGAPRSLVTRSLVRAGAGSRFTLIERHINLCTGPVHGNEALVLHASSRADVEHVAIHESGQSGHVFVRSLLAQVWDDAALKSFALVEGGGFLRRQVYAEFKAQRSKLSLAGASLLNGKAHADTTLIVDHANPGNLSREYFKHIVDEQATGVFQGKIIVAPDAQKTDGVMKSQTILLSDGAAMYNKPELEIFADDVACGHGATVGALDPNQLFYVMSRGLPRAEAEALLLEGFAGDAIEHVSDEGLREELLARVRGWLAGRVSA